MTWELPIMAEFGGVEYAIASDFRDIFEIISYFQSEEDEEIRAYIVLSLFYEDYNEIPREYLQDAANYLNSFIDCFEQHDVSAKPKTIDWEQDRNMIAAEVNKIAGCEVRLLPYLHWFTFVGYFYAIGEGQLATICSIRKKKREGKNLEKWEQQFYRENKAKIDFQHKEKPVEYEESESAKAFWAAFNGE